MTGKSPIEWTEQTWNPIVGCSIVSPGCTNCYAMSTAWRFKSSYLGRKVAGPPAENVVRKMNGKAVWTGQLAMAPDYGFLAPLHRKKPTVYFVNSMGDLFHEDCPDEWIDRVFAVMALAPQHTFQVLTKRAKRMREYCAYHAGVWCPAHRTKPLLSEELIVDLGMGRSGPLPNVWLGVSAERQAEADERIPLLLQTPAAIRFISAEPLLGPIDLSVKMTGVNAFGNKPINGLDWVIAGGESGPGARPMHPAWPRSLRDQCTAAGVAYFFKQWGEWKPSTPEDAAGNPHSGWMRLAAHPHVAKAAELYPEAGAKFIARVGKKAAGRTLDGELHNAMPAVRT